MKELESARNIIKVNPPKKKDIIAIRTLICIGLISMCIFLGWFLNSEHIGSPILFWLLTFGLFFKLGKMVHEWYHYWSPSVPVPPKMKKEWTVDVLTTFCPGEPKDMIIRTLTAMKAIRYPHTNYLCDEGNDPELKKFCEENGIIHVTRTEKKDAKAGNINNALKQAAGEICVVLDPDHVPVPEFLDRTLPYFEDEKIGYVQCVQGYSNQDESLIARGAAEQTYHFYGPMMMSMNTYGTVQAIGANCTFRRKALDSIGGHAPGLAEDMHTAMQLHAKGWKSVYIPEMLTKGLVPGTLSGYYKQQLKWTRGVFELLFRVYPGLFKNFTWRQKLHYLTVPMYFIFGLVNLIDLAVPILSLSFAAVAWEIDVGKFALLFFPLCLLSIMIRLYAQRWLLEKHEQGFQLAGGFLYAATWWIFLAGFVYSILNINVPYIPTPKEDEHRNCWKLCLPNLIALGISLIAVWYGLYIDWTPFSIAMGGYAILNAALLAFITITAQQRLLADLVEKTKKIKWVDYLLAPVQLVFQKTHEAAYSMVKNGQILFLSLVPLLFLNYESLKKENEADEKDPMEDERFYSGIHLNSTLYYHNAVSNQLSREMDLYSFRVNWREKDKWLPEKLMDHCKKNGVIPVLNWDPYINEDTTGSNELFKAVIYGYLDEYLAGYAEKLKEYGEPVFINFAPGFDKKKNEPDAFVAAWRYIFIYFNNKGLTNLTWMWTPGNFPAAAYYPGKKYVDWIGYSTLSKVKKSKKKKNSFNNLYKRHHKELVRMKKPVMIIDFHASCETEEVEWLENAFETITKKFHEIRSVIISESELKNKTSISLIKTKLREAPFNKHGFIKNYRGICAETKKYQSRFLKGNPGSYELILHGKPYYIKGVAYNTGHDWRDGNVVLTRRQLQKDFRLIKEMGANTIRRYGCDIYDRNVLDLADEEGLKVIMGFWFDPATDYYKDTLKLKKYIDEVVNNVEKFKDHNAVLAWSLGNETWGLLKHHFPKPYLCKVRQHYIQLIEYLAQRVHAIDPSRPVLSCMEHEESQLGGEIASFRNLAPSVDIIGINSYYKEQISKLDSVFNHFDGQRPYIVSEFGPSGYWHDHYNDVRNNLLFEESEAKKADWYKTQWNDYVLANKGKNVGGVAYCWRDRMEGSCTWFGITDYKGRLKPSYAALKETWTGNRKPALPSFSIFTSEKYVSGSKCQFKIYPEVHAKGLNYEWYLHVNDYLERIDIINVSGDGKSVSVKVPEDTLNYRLYLYVSDDFGNVTTASAPVKSFGQQRKPR